MKLNQAEVAAILTDLQLSERWIRIFQTQSVQQQRVALDQTRAGVLHQIHHCQEQLEQLDYLRYQLNRPVTAERKVLKNNGS
ncbi:hypothetical protein D1831_09920 [Lactiplantibacillus garii]|uniref:Uncharacterized protein n=1 Tax=Lactiplantibacillus garii TaxID=2306423 RepID=A0A3R8KHJ1_9LACO|nr:hypothetical protein [Lactiplantibacillus garii]RRK09942.1 hypothetical protein D1831_09920 [Lactiplantibacillus garii]